MSRFVLAMLTLLYASVSIAYGEDDLVGSWKLVSALMKDVENGEVSDAYGGPHPTGFLSYGRDHRVMAMAAYDRRIKPARVDQTTPEQRDQLYQTYFAYAGTFSVSDGAAPRLELQVYLIFCGDSGVKDGSGDISN
jgi:hypothetical protein